MEDDQISSLFRPEFMLTASALLQAIDRMGVGLAITNPNLPDNPLVYVNQGFEKITGYKREEVLNRNLRFLQGKETNKEHLAVIRKAIKEIRAATVTIKNYKKDGSTFWNQFVISPILDAEGHPLYFIGLQFDVTREVEMQQASTEQLRQLSHFDPATHLMSSNYFKELMYAELLSAQAEHTTAAVICINL